jgi:hypothetical protein
MSAVSGNPAINLVDAVETNGGTLYLSDTNVAGVELQRDLMRCGHRSNALHHFPFQDFSFLLSMVLPRQDLCRR